MPLWCFFLNFRWFYFKKVITFVWKKMQCRFDTFFNGAEMSWCRTVFFNGCQNVLVPNCLVSPQRHPVWVWTSLLVSFIAVKLVLKKALVNLLWSHHADPTIVLFQFDKYFDFKALYLIHYSSLFLQFVTCWIVKLFVEI